MGFFKKIKSGFSDLKDNMANMEIGASLKHLEGLKGIPEGVLRVLKVAPEDNKLYISPNSKSKNVIEIELDDINFIEKMNMSEVTEKNKSVVGRAVVGGLLGPLGAIVGGISGVGSKKKNKDVGILIIGYGEDKQISFASGKGTFGYGNIVRALQMYTK